MAGKDPGARFRTLLAAEGTVTVPGVFSPAVALLAQSIGFKVLYFSGAAFSNLLGLPDLGVTTLSEVSRAAGMITARVDLPLIVDVDTGFGEVVNVVRTVREMERMGVAAIQMEDQVMPKRCGHLAGKEIVEVEEMAKKLIASKEAVSGGMAVVARTDAASVEGFDSAVERARLYLRAGADVIFPEALTSEAQFTEFAKKVRAPLLANMTEFGRTPYLTVSQFSRMGYKMVIFPVTTFRVMMKAVRGALMELQRSGTQRGLIGRMMTREQYYDLIGYRGEERADGRAARRAQALLDTD